MSACWSNCCCMGLLGVEATANAGLFTTSGGVILYAVASDVVVEFESLADGEVIATRPSHWCDN
jgi:hypothetical protein